MAGDISSCHITPIVTPSEPDRRGRDTYQPRRQKPAAPVAKQLEPEEPLPGLPDPIVPPHIGTRINVRV